MEGALETARKDFARLMREAMALQRGQAMPDDPARLGVGSQRRLTLTIRPIRQKRRTSGPALFALSVSVSEGPYQLSGVGISTGLTWNAPQAVQLKVKRSTFASTGWGSLPTKRIKPPQASQGNGARLIFL